jgi:flagellar hook-associated protein 3 FlgL
MVLRVTPQMVMDSTLSNIEANQNRIQQLQTQLTSGSRLYRPSDDPIGVSRAISLQTGLDQAGQYSKNIDQGSAWLNSTDSALGAVTDSLQRARELAVQAANDTMTSSDRAAIQQEITQIQQHVLDLANSKYGAYYLFSGTRSNQAGYVTAADTGSNPGAYQGDTNQVLREVSAGVTLAVNADAKSTFDPVFKALSDLQTGLTSNSAASIQTSVSSFDSALDAVNSTRASVGARLNRLDTLKQRQDAVTTSLTSLLSNDKDVDMAAAITQFTTAQTVYQASLKAGAQAMQPSLLDYLK